MLSNLKTGSLQFNLLCGYSVLGFAEDLCCSSQPESVSCHRHCFVRGLTREIGFPGPCP